MTIFFTSDTHFGHKNIIEYCGRPWDSVEEMNEGLVENWNKTVAPNDIVYVLGDVCMGKIDDSLKYVKRLNGKKRLRPGNHDRCWVGNDKTHDKNGMPWVLRYGAVGLPVTTERLFRTENDVFLMDHFPYEGDHTDEDRYSEYRPKDEGLWLLHGHVHDEWVFRPVERMINVGIDVWNYRPVAIETLVELKNHYA